MLTTASGAAVLRPEEVDELLVRPTFDASVAAQVCRVVTTDAGEFRIPVVVEDPSAAWVAEGAEIPVDDAVLAEVTVTPSKVAGLSVITRELAEDSSPEAAAVVGEGLARDLARQIDRAYFGSLAAPAPSGLGALSGVSPVSAGASFTTLDPFAEAAAAVEQAGGDVFAWVTTPAVALALARIKTGTGAVTPLLAPGGDPAQPARRLVEGRPLLVSPYVAAGTVWGVPAGRTVLVVRADSRIEIDGSVYFTSDRLALRATMRVGFGFPHPAAVVKITTTAP